MRVFSTLGTDCRVGARVIARRTYECCSGQEGAGKSGEGVEVNVVDDAGEEKGEEEAGKEENSVLNA
jgi:hypothetical protein